MSAAECHDDDGREPNPQLTLVNDVPEGPFFAMDNGVKPDYEHLADVAKGLSITEASADPRALLTAVLEETGFMQSSDAIQALKEQRHDMLDTAPHSESTVTFMRHVDAQLETRAHQEQLLRAVQEYYQTEFFETPHGTLTDTDKIGELYDATDQYQDCPLLSTIRQFSNEYPGYTRLAHEADRLARVLCVLTFNLPPAEQLV